METCIDSLSNNSQNPLLGHEFDLLYNDWQCFLENQIGLNLRATTVEKLKC